MASISNPLTKSTALDDDDYYPSWEKPEWTKTNSLKVTNTRQDVKNGMSLAMEITHINKDEDQKDEKLSWETPSWAAVPRSPELRKTKKGEKLQATGNLQRNITFPNGKNHYNKQGFEDEHDNNSITENCSDDDDSKGFEAEIKIVKHDDNNKSEENTNTCQDGSQRVQKEEVVNSKNTEMKDKEKPSKQMRKPAPVIVAHNNTNYDVDDDDCYPSWEKPEWTKKPPLKGTTTGQEVKSGKSLAREITHINKDEEKNKDVNLSWEKPEWTVNPALRETKKGKKLQVTGNLERPITFPNGKDF